MIFEDRVFFTYKTQLKMNIIYEAKDVYDMKETGLFIEAALTHLLWLTLFVNKIDSWPTCNAAVSV